MVAPTTLPAHVPADKAMSLPFFERRVVGECPQETMIPRMHATLGPITWVTNVFPGDQPGWLLTHYDDVIKVLRDADNYTKNGMGKWAQSIGEDWLVIPTETDPPSHTAYRRTLNPYFSPQRMALMKGQLHERATALIAAFRDRGHCDFIKEFAEKFPIYIVLDLLGLPQERMEQFLAWEHDLLHSPDYQRRTDAVRHVKNYLMEEIRARQAVPRDDYISKVLDFESDGRRWTETEVFGHCFNLYIGGLDTVTSMLSNIFTWLARYPDRQQELRDHPEWTVTAVEEFLRVFGVTSVFRIATTEHEIHGQKIMPGDYVCFSSPLIGQDPDHYENPGEIRFDRQEAHLALGGGIHKCMGMHLARFELQTALEELLKALPPFRIKDGFEVGWYVGNITNVPELELQWD